MKSIYLFQDSIVQIKAEMKISSMIATSVRVIKIVAASGYHSRVAIALTRFHGASS